MHPNISEFSYGYALVEELATRHRDVLTAAPVLPSLSEEGQAGVGWDVRLDTLGIPAFLQFKIGHRMVRRNAKECVRHGWFPPFYRMHVRPSRLSDQHQSLVDLEAAGELVWYVAPVFDTPAELNDFYASRAVADNSFWIRPSAIPIPDDKDHHVGYVGPAGPFCICSPESRLFEADGSFGGFVERVRLRSREAHGDLGSRMENLADLLTDKVLRRPDSAEVHERRPGGSEAIDRFRPDRQQNFPSDAGLFRKKPPTLAASLLRLRELPPARRAAYLARTFFDAELLVVGPPLGDTAA